MGYANRQANNFLITKRLKDGGLSMKDKQYALDLAVRCKAEDTKPTPAPVKTYLTAAVDPALDIDEKKEKKEHIAMLLSFFELQHHCQRRSRLVRHRVRDRVHNRHPLCHLCGRDRHSPCVCHRS